MSYPQKRRRGEEYISPSTQKFSKKRRLPKGLGNRMNCVKTFTDSLGRKIDLKLKEDISQYLDVSTLGLYFSGMCTSVGKLELMNNKGKKVQKMITMSTTYPELAKMKIRDEIDSYLDKNIDTIVSQLKEELDAARKVKILENKDELDKIVDPEELEKLREAYNASHVRNNGRRYKNEDFGKSKEAGSTVNDIIRAFSKSGNESPINVLLKESPVLLKESPVLLKESPVLLKESPVLLKESPVLLKESPVLLKESPVLLKESPVLLKESPVLLKEPSFVLKKPHVELKNPQIQLCESEDEPSPIRYYSGDEEYSGDGKFDFTYDYSSDKEMIISQMAQNCMEAGSFFSDGRYDMGMEYLSSKSILYGELQDKKLYQAKMYGLAREMMEKGKLVKSTQQKDTEEEKKLQELKALREFGLDKYKS